MVIDLTKTTRYYDAYEWGSYNVWYYKVCSQAGGMTKQAAGGTAMVHAGARLLSFATKEW